MRGIVTLGEALGVLTPKYVGRLASGSELILRIAGSELNVAIALAHLDVPTWFAGAVGDDVVGDNVRRVLLAEGVNVELLDVREGNTGLLIKERFGLKHEPRVYYYRQESAMQDWSPRFLWEPLASVDWLHLSGITLMLSDRLGQDVAKGMRRWSMEGQRQISLDINLRYRLAEPKSWRERLEDLLPTVSIIFASRSELLALWGSAHSTELVEKGVINDRQVVVITDGANGAWAQMGDQELARSEAWPVDRVEDVVGAGDGFAGGVLAARYRGWNWSDSLQLGSLVGAFGVAHPGDWEGYPRWVEAQSLLHQRWVDR